MPRCQASERRWRTSPHCLPPSLECRRPSRREDATTRSSGLCGGGGGASQKSFAVEIGFTTRDETGIVGVAVKLEHESRLAGRLAEKRLNVGIWSALEVRDADDVQVAISAGDHRSG